MPTVTVTDPSASPVLSRVVATVWVTDPPTGTVTDCCPKSPAPTKAPVSATVNDTVNAADGAGEAVTVKVAGVPSVTAEPALTLTNGSDAVPSSLTIPTEADPEAESRPPPSPDACI